MIKENLSTLKINKLTKEQFERALAQNRIQSDQLYMVPDESSGEGEYLPLTGGVLTGNDGSTIGLYPNAGDGEMLEPGIEINNEYGDCIYINPAAVDLKYGSHRVSMSAEESFINIGHNSGGECNILLKPGYLELQYADNSYLFLSAEEGNIIISNNDGQFILNNEGITKDENFVKWSEISGKMMVSSNESAQDIQVVDNLPPSPDDNTLYFIK